MTFKALLRGLLIDVLAGRDDRCYWRQATVSSALPAGAHLCLWQPDGKLGDAVILTALVQAIQAQRPDVGISVVCASGLIGYWQQIAGVNQALCVDPPQRQRTAEVMQALGSVDVFISLEAFLSLDTVRFVRRLRPVLAVGFSVAPYRLFDIALVDMTYAFPRRHISQRLHALCELMHLAPPAPTDLRALARSAQTPRVTLAPASPRIFLNTMGAARHRSLQRATVALILERLAQLAPACPVVLSVSTEDRAHWSAQLGPSSPVQLTPPHLSLPELISLVGQCPCVITPDTAIGHIGAATGARVAVLYADRHYNPVVWSPMTDSLLPVLPDPDGDVNNVSTSQIDHMLAQLLQTPPGPST